VIELMIGFKIRNQRGQAPIRDFSYITLAGRKKLILTRPSPLGEG
jgi:hypothetical protein